jgi:TorA maturation chaperone TorD
MMTVTGHDPQQTTHGTNKDAMVTGEDVFRANIYGLLARMLTEPPSDDTMEILRALNGHGDGTEIVDALANLGAVAVRTPVGRANEEFTKLFYGHGAGGEVHPYASFYLTGFVYEKPLADLRADLTEIGIERSGHNSEPEDHIAFLCEVMHGLITGAFGQPGDTRRQQDFFRKHIAPWAAMLFADLEAAQSAALYMPLAALARQFLAIEAEAFEMAA